MDNKAPGQKRPEDFEPELLTPFKVDVFWDAFSPQITTRILRDMFELARLATANRSQLIVACDIQLSGYLRQLGIMVTDDFAAAQMCRVYVQAGFNVPDEVYDRLPEDVNFDVISLNTKPWMKPPITVIPDDPYGNMPDKQMWKRIPLTMPLDRAPPRGTPEPMFSPFL